MKRFLKAVAWIVAGNIVLALGPADWIGYVLFAIGAAHLAGAMLTWIAGAPDKPSAGG